MNAIRERWSSKTVSKSIRGRRDHLVRANEQLTMTLDSREAFDAHGEVEGYEIALKTSREENKFEKTSIA